MTFLFAGITLDVTHVLDLILVFLCYLDAIDRKGWRASLPTFLTLFPGLGLRLISGRGVMGLSLFFVFARSFITVLLIGVFLVLFDQRAIGL